ncbi:MAG: GyrI-like domain-containing protein [Methanobacteriaceae archaeon]
MNFEKKIVESEKISYIKHIGKVEEVPMVMGKLMEWAYKNNINIAGPPCSLYYTDPSMVDPEEMVYDMIIPVSGDVKGNDEVKIKEVPEHTVISVIHKGDYSSLSETYMGIWNYIQENEYLSNGYPKEIYLNSPQEVSPDELLTEIQFPVEK